MAIRYRWPPSPLIDSFAPLSVATTLLFVNLHSFILSLSPGLGLGFFYPFALPWAPCACLCLPNPIYCFLFVSLTPPLSLTRFRPPLGHLATAFPADETCRPIPPQAAAPATPSSTLPVVQQKVRRWLLSQHGSGLPLPEQPKADREPRVNACLERRAAAGGPMQATRPPLRPKQKARRHK